MYKNRMNKFEFKNLVKGLKDSLKEKTFFSLNDRLKKSRKIAKNEKKIFVKLMAKV